MKNRKRRIEPFSFFNQEGIRLHLEKMAQKGWMIEKLTNMGWLYRAIEPKKIHFAISYYPKASEFDPEPTEGQKMFHEFCSYTGWKLACTSAQMQIFYNEQENPIPIETEPELELEAIHASAKKAFLPSYFLLLGISILNGFLFFSNLFRDPIGLLSSSTQLFSEFCFAILTVICGVELICYFCWYMKAKKAVDCGVFLSPMDTSAFQKIVLILILISGGYYAINLFFSGNPMLRWLVLLLGIYFPILYMLVNGTKEFLKKKKASRGMNRTVTTVLSFLLSFIMMGGITFGTIWLSSNGFFAASDEETYEYHRTTWVVHKDELPLVIEDFMDVDYEGYSKERRGEESVLLGQMVLTQRPRLDAEDFALIPNLEYTLTIVKMPFLYEICKERLIYEQEELYPIKEQSYEVENPLPWGANEVYHLYDYEYGFRNDYLLCYDHVLVEICFSWEPTIEQMEIVGEILGKLEI